MIYRHGDLLIKEVKKIPKLPKLKTNILAFGEVTGHHHSLSGKSQVFGEGQPQYLIVEQEAELVHQEHKPILIGKGAYQIIREREYNPFEKEIRQVQD